MIDNIDKININNEVKEKMINNLSNDILVSLSLNYILVNQNIAYLESIGIKNIDLLLLNREYLFLNDTNYIKESIGRFNLSSFVQLINDDYTIIDEAF